MIMTDLNNLNHYRDFEFQPDNIIQEVYSLNDDMEAFNILFTSVGRRVSLIQAFKKALRDLDTVGNIIAVDGKRNAPALYVADF